MDDIVRQAIAKWPNVPHCHGWLGLDARGQWWLRDGAAQAAGPFPASRGTLLRHDKLIGFIHRNYAHDEAGQWFFQNGPQRVYVELEATPWIWRMAEDFSLRAHTDEPAAPTECLLDEAGRLYFAAAQGLGLLHTQDVALAAEAIEQGRWQPREARAADLPAAYGFVMSPAAARPTKKPPEGGS